MSEQELNQELKSLILKYGSSKIIEEMSKIALESADKLYELHYHNAEMVMRRQAANLFMVARKDCRMEMI